MQSGGVKRVIIKTAIVMLTIIILPFVGRAQVHDTTRAKSVAGNWEGKLSASGINLRIRFHIRRDNSGNLIATMDSPDQNANGIPVASVIQHKNSVKLDVSTIRGTYEGTLSTDAEHLNGTWKQGGQAFPLAMKRMGKHTVEEEVVRPQEPKPPYPYHADSVTFQNNVDHVRLAGTMTYPDGKGPFPALVLISGSGAQDRNETIMGHKPFLVIADYLTRHGFAVLRYDDRGVGGSGGNMHGATTRDLSNDAAAAVRYLSGQKIVDKKRIGLIGHSEGGVQAILLATRDKQINALVLLATPAEPGSTISVEQIENISKARGAPQAAIDKNVRLQKKVLPLLKDRLDSTQTLTHVQEILKEEYPDLSDSRRQSMAANITSQLTNPWGRYYMTFDPRHDLAELNIPVLALYGSRDLQVSAKTNLPAAQKALSNNYQAKAEVLHGLNHLFQEADTGLPEEYGQIQQTFSPEALAVIGQWLDIHLK